MADGDVATLDPVTAPPESPAEAAPAREIVVDATQAYERYDFPNTPPASDKPAAAGEETGKSAPATPPDDLSDEALAALWQKNQDRLEKLPDYQARQERLLENKHGNTLQIERARIERETREAVQAEEADWAKAADFYYDLQNDPAFRAQEIARLNADGQNGEAALKVWEGTYEVEHGKRETERRAPKAASDPAAIAALKTEFATSFNGTAIGEFQEYARQAIPFYADLPEDTRKAIDTLKYDPAGNWFADGLSALGKGVQKHIETLQQQHTRALAEARLAGKNEAHADREDSGPVIVANQEGGYTTPYELDRAYNRGQIDRNTYHAERRRLGVKD